MHLRLCVYDFGRIERGNAAETIGKLVLPKYAICALKVVVVLLDCIRALLALEIGDLAPEPLPVQPVVAVLASHGDRLFILLFLKLLHGLLCVALNIFSY